MITGEYFAGIRMGENWENAKVRIFGYIWQNSALPPGNRIIGQPIQQNNDSKHTAKVFRDFLGAKIAPESPFKVLIYYLFSYYGISWTGELNQDNYKMLNSFANDCGKIGN